MRFMVKIYIMVYIGIIGGFIILTAKLFENGRSQAVRLPKEYRFKGNDVFIKKVGDAVILVPIDKEWEVFLHGLNNFSKDFMLKERIQGNDQKRDDF